MFTANVLGFGAMAIGAIVFFVWQNRLSVIAKSKAAKDVANQAALNAAAWLLDYHNPASVNYDPTRIATEEAAAAAAWLLDPTNPDSVNYDPEA